MYNYENTLTKLLHTIENYCHSAYNRVANVLCINLESYLYLMSIKPCIVVPHKHFFSIPRELTVMSSIIRKFLYRISKANHRVSLFRNEIHAYHAEITLRTPVFSCNISQPCTNEHQR